MSPTDVSPTDDASGLGQASEEWSDQMIREIEQWFREQYGITDLNAGGASASPARAEHPDEVSRMRIPFR